jgi:hypothetical protein
MRLGLAVLLISILASCGPDLNPSANYSPQGSDAGHASAPRISPPPVTPPTPPGTYLPPFACADAKGGKTGVANTITARGSEQQGYDRFVLQLDPIVPAYTVKRQARPVFTNGASGQSVTLSGTAGVLITVNSAKGATTFTGSTDLVFNGFQVLQEARQIQDFEGYVSWGLGLSRPACMRVFVLNNPARLVVDLQTT